MILQRDYRYHEDSPQIAVVPNQSRLVSEPASVAKPKYSCLPAKAIGRMGISKEIKYDYTYEYLRTFQFDRIYTMRMSNPYQLFIPNSRQLQQYLGNECYTYVISEFRRIANDSNKKRKELLQILLRNPFLPLSQKATSVVYSEVLDDFIHKIDRGYVFMFPVLVIGLFFLFAILIPCVIIDMVTCKLRELPSPSEVNWLQQQFASHPELNNTAIDEHINFELYMLSYEMFERFGKDAVVWCGVECVQSEVNAPIGAKQSADIDEFMLIILSEAEVVDAEVQVQEQDHNENSDFAYGVASSCCV